MVVMILLPRSCTNAEDAECKCLHWKCYEMFQKGKKGDVKLNILWFGPIVNDRSNTVLILKLFRLQITIFLFLQI